MSCELKKVISESDWKSYHAIRKAELFVGHDYDENHADEYVESNIPLSLKDKNELIGTARFDIHENNAAVIRLMAIRKDKQNKGYGRKFVVLLEDFASVHSINKLLVNAAPQAIGFYSKLGFQPKTWDENELIGIAADCIQMSKILI